MDISNTVEFAVYPRRVVLYYLYRFSADFRARICSRECFSRHEQYFIHSEQVFKMPSWMRKGSRKNRTVIIVLILIMGGTSLFNILFMLHTASELTDKDADTDQYDHHDAEEPQHLLVPSALYWKKRDDSVASPVENQFLKIEVLSSKDNVTVIIDGKLHMDRSEMLIRGMNVVVLNEVTGAVMSSRWYDTYESLHDSRLLLDHLQGLRRGRILCFAIKDEASLQLNDDVRTFIKRLGSNYVSQIKWRSMWAFVVQRLESQSIVYGESLQQAAGHDSWGSSVHLYTTVKLLPAVHVKCNWYQSQENTRRREFCDKYEGYSNVCSCDNPLSLDFNPPPFQDGSRLKLPLAVMASNRPVYLLRMLLSLRTVEGLDISLVTVFIDGFFDEPASVAKLFDLNVEHHAGVGKLNTRISQHYKKSLAWSFAQHPDANFLMIFEEDLSMSVDVLSYFKQLLPVFENDKSVYCISAWNDQGYKHLSNDPAMLYRVETMPGLGWVLSRRLFKDELEKKWPRPDQPHDWDMWMRMDFNKKGRECIIPDISRTFHFGAKGLNIGSFMQEIYFDTHALNTVKDVKFDIDLMYKDNYEKEMLRLIRKAKLLDHSKSPCVELQDFVPNTEGETYVFYFRKKNSVDFKTWRNIARCFRMWDLDNRGFHESAWRFWIKKNHVIAIGCPASIYCKNKPEYLEPIALPDKVTRPRDPV